MVQMVFLDTNIILDYVEGRHRDVVDVIKKLLRLNKEGKISVVTSVLNIAELVDNEFQIRFIETCMHDKNSCDEILRILRRNKILYKQIGEKNRNIVEKKVKDFILQNEVGILPITSADLEQDEEIDKLLYDIQLRSQDAIIVASALMNKVTYFLSNDNDLVLSVEDFLHSYNLRDDVQRESFRNDVLEAI